MVKDDPSAPSAKETSSGMIRIRGDANIFANEMKKLVNNKEFSDIKFIVGQQRKQIFAHRCIIMARCQVFKAMFTEQQNKAGKQDTDTPLVLSDIQPEVFLAILEYIYTNTLTISPKMAFDTVGSAIEYGLDDLQKVVINFLQTSMSPQNACEALRVAVTYGRDELKQRAMAYVEDHAMEVVHDKSFHEISESGLALILQSDRLNLDEFDVLTAVREWANINSVTQGKSPASVSRNAIAYLRLSILTPEELAKIEDENKKEGLVPAEQFSFAWKCHALKRSTDRLRIGTKRRQHHTWMQGAPGSTPANEQ